MCICVNTILFPFSNSRLREEVGVYSRFRGQRQREIGLPFFQSVSVPLSSKLPKHPHRFDSQSVPFEPGEVLRGTVLCTFRLSVRQFNDTHFISAMNALDARMVKVRFRPLNYRTGDSDEHNTILQFVPFVVWYEF